MRHSIRVRREACRRTEPQPILEPMEARSLLSAVSGIPTNVNVTQEADNQSEGAIAIDPTNPRRMFMVSNQEYDEGLFSASSVDGGPDLVEEEHRRRHRRPARRLVRPQHRLRPVWQPLRQLSQRPWQGHADRHEHGRRPDVPSLAVDPLRGGPAHGRHRRGRDLGHLSVRRVDRRPGRTYARAWQRRQVPPCTEGAQVGRRQLWRHSHRPQWAGHGGLSVPGQRRAHQRLRKPRS